MRKEAANQICGLLKVFGHVVGVVGGEKFDARARALAAGNVTLSTTAETLLAARAALATQVARLDKLLLTEAPQDPNCQRLMSVPGVGAYLGLTLRRYQSGMMDVSGHISKAGDALLRCYLFKAATTLLVRAQKTSALRNTARIVSAVRMASGEYRGCPPQVVRGSAAHAASVSHTARLPR